MGRNRRQTSAADQTATDQTVADQTSAATDASAPAVAEVKPITMLEFMTLPDRADWLSINEAAKRVNGDSYEPKHDQTIRNAVKNRAEFRQPGALVSVLVDGYNIPPLTYINVAAIDSYAANASAGNVGRLVNGRKRWITRLTADELAAYNAGTLALTVDKFPLEVASTAKPTKAEREAAEAAKAASANGVDTSDVDQAQENTDRADAGDGYDASFETSGITTSADL